MIWDRSGVLLEEVCTMAIGRIVGWNRIVDCDCVWSRLWISCCSVDRDSCGPSSPSFGLLLLAAAAWSSALCVCLAAAVVTSLFLHVTSFP